MKKMKRNVIASSIMAIGLCASIITGATYALFTSHSDVNIVVTSGKVDVVANVANLSYQSTLSGGPLAQSSAVVNDNSITIDKMVPGDFVDFDLIIKNNSNVKVQYRTIIKKVADNGLWNGLNVTIDGQAYNGVKKITAWEALEPNSADMTVHVKVELPEDKGNEYQNKTCTFSYAVEAVQGNAEVSNPVVVAPENQAEVNEALTGSGDSDIYLELNEGTYTLPAVSNKEVIITGNGRDKTKIDMIHSAMNNSQNGGLNITFEDATVEFANADYKGIMHSSKVTYKDCTLIGKQFLYANDVEFDNCTFVNDADYAVWTYGSNNATFKNCVFQSGGKAILIYVEDATHTNNVIVDNCVFYDNDYLDVTKAAIEIGDSQPNSGLKVNLKATNNKVYGFALNDEGTPTGSKMWGNKNAIPAERLTVRASNNLEYDAAVSYSGEASKVLKTLKSKAKDIKVFLAQDIVVDSDSATAFTNALGGVNTETITIDGQGKYTLNFKNNDSDANHVVTNGAKLILKNLHLTNSGFNANNRPWNTRDIVFDCEVVLENVTSDKAIALGDNAVLKNVTINESADAYALWIKANVSNVEMDNVTLNCPNGRGIAIKDEYIDENDRVSVNLIITNSKIVSAKKAAIIVTNTAGATITADNVDISDVAADSVNLVWIDVDRPGSVVTVTGATVITEP